MDFFSWESTLAEFKKKAADFKTALDFLKNPTTVSNTSSALDAERKKLIASGDVIKSTIEKTTSAIDAANRTLSTVKTAVGLDGLGVLPLVLPVAVVAAAITAISYWLTDFDRLRTKMYTDLQASGKTPAEAAKILSTLPGQQSSISNGIVKTLAPLFLIGGVIYVFFKKGNL